MDMVKNIKFRNVADNFLRSLKDDANKVTNSKKDFIPSDKTTNFYKLGKPQYNKLLKESNISTYRKADKTSKISIDRETRPIAADLKIDDRTEYIAPQQDFITLKDHKENFANNPTCRLINPAKSELGIVSKKILGNINTNIRRKTALNQWKNTAAVLEWFKAIPEKNKFTVFDIESFYPSITKNLLLNALNYAKTHATITDHDINIIYSIRQRHRLGKENQ